VDDVGAPRRLRRRAPAPAPAPAEKPAPARPKLPIEEAIAAERAAMKADYDAANEAARSAREALTPRGGWPDDAPAPAPAPAPALDACVRKGPFDAYEILGLDGDGPTPRAAADGAGAAGLTREDIVGPGA